MDATDLELLHAWGEGDKRAVNSAASFYEADIRGLDGQGSNMDQIDLVGAIQSQSDGTFTATYTDFYGNSVPIGLRYGPTILGSTADARSSRRRRPAKHVQA